jgi:hypothetical protein
MHGHRLLHKIIAGVFKQPQLPQLLGDELLVLLFSDDHVISLLVLLAKGREII